MISVVIPAYNAEAYLEKCLLSLKNQTFKDFEIIVVDDGSTDDTSTIASKYATVARSGINKGEGAARNLGVSVACGDILVFTDADVVAPPDWLYKIAENMQKYNVKCVAGGYSGLSGPSFMEKFACLELVHRRKKTQQYVTTAVSNNFACSKDVFLECGGFPEKFKCEDLRLSFKISRKYKIYWDKENSVFHHFRPSLAGYLKQQFYFARDTVWSYYQFPDLVIKRTHQGRRIYLETLLMFGVLSGLFFSMILSVICLLLIILLHIRFFLFLRQKHLSVIRSFFVILARDIVCVFGFFAGVGLCLRNIIENLNH